MSPQLTNGPTLTGRTGAHRHKLITDHDRHQMFLLLCPDYLDKVMISQTSEKLQRLTT